jgi:hypothetical protein
MKSQALDMAKPLRSGTGRAPFLLLAAILVCFVLGVMHVFRLRFESGDIYAPYSSLRADPLGVKALFESLNKLPQLSVQRHYRTLGKLTNGHEATLFYLGARISEWSQPPEDTVKHLESLANSGARVIITFFPETKTPRSAGPPRPREEQPRRGEKQPPEIDEFPGQGVPKVALPERWGIRFEYEELPKNEDGEFASVVAGKRMTAAIPNSISWHTALSFGSLADAWKVVYAREDHAVMIERKWGLGSIVLSADSYFFSNEAMQSERHADLLSWVVGASKRIVFDEAHLGMHEESGVVALARSYRLHAFFAAILFLAALYVWKNAVSFVPSYEDDPPDQAGGLVAGKDTTAGFVHLLRRSISPREILGVCFSEWKKSCTHGRVNWQDKLQRMQEIIEEEKALPPNRRNPVRSYQTLSRILAERK